MTEKRSQKHKEKQKITKIQIRLSDIHMTTVTACAYANQNIDLYNNMKECKLFEDAPFTTNGK